MKAGDLDRRVTILRATSVPNELNEPIETWSKLTSVWASFEPISDGERVRALQIGAFVTARFQVRWSRTMATVTAMDRLFFAGRICGISGVKEIGRREGIEITAAGDADESAP